MTESSIFLYVMAEIAAVLLLIAIFLIFNIKKLKAIIGILQDKLASSQKALKISLGENKKINAELVERKNIKPQDYLHYLDQEIDGTRDFHQTLNPDRDIVLDIAPDAPLERQATSLRHALLIAEKEARYAGDGDSSSWDVLQSKFQQIIHFYVSATAEPVPPVAAADSDEIANFKKRIENLEGFKRLFFEMEDKWTKAKALADDYYQQLKALGEQTGGGAEFEELLNKYSGAFDEVGNLIAERSGRLAATQSTADANSRINNGSKSKMVFANQEEMQHLRDMAVDQYKLIEELKKKLVLSDSVEQKEQAITEMTGQLEQHQRFLKEAETCTQLIEDELSRAFEENERLRKQLNASEPAPQGALDAEEIERLETMIAGFTDESRDMLSTIASLEQENANLLEQLKTGSASGAPDNSPVLNQKLQEMQQELLNMQTQHIELEERYLELKMKDD
ncbi:MAG: hypothetical protein ACI9WS_002539 [Paraglaciecola psychrophila]|jgi:hypothetical protein